MGDSGRRPRDHGKTDAGLWLWLVDLRHDEAGQIHQSRRKSDLESSSPRIRIYVHLLCWYENSLCLKVTVASSADVRTTPRRALQSSIYAVILGHCHPRRECRRVYRLVRKPSLSTPSTPPSPPTDSDLSLQSYGQRHVEHGHSRIDVQSRIRHRHRTLSPRFSLRHDGTGQLDGRARHEAAVLEKKRLRKGWTAAKFHCILSGHRPQRGEKQPGCGQVWELYGREHTAGSNGPNPSLSSDSCSASARLTGSARHREEAGPLSITRGLCIILYCC